MDFDYDSLTTMQGGEKLAFMLKNKTDNEYYAISMLYPSFIEYGKIHIEVDEKLIKFLDNNMVKKIIMCSIYEITRRGRNIEANSSVIENFIKENDSKKYIHEIEPYYFDGDVDISDETTRKLCIEKPVRSSCEMLYSNGITCLMSSANQKNVESKNIPIPNIIEINQDDSWSIGNGYAWILIDLDSLNDDAREFIKEEVTKNPKYFQLYKYIANFDKDNILNENNIICGKNSLINYRENINILLLRYPVDNNTLVSDVENHFKMVATVLCNKQTKNEIVQNNLDETDGSLSPSNK